MAQGAEPTLGCFGVSENACQSVLTLTQRSCEPGCGGIQKIYGIASVARMWMTGLRFNRQRSNKAALALPT